MSKAHSLDQCLLAIDQGTTSSRAIVFSPNARIIASAQSEFPQHFPHDGWVEHDPEDIWQTTLDACRKVMAKSRQQGAKVRAIGVTNQRETAVVWDRATGEPINRALVWQDRRTAQHCRDLKQAGHEKTVTDKTGLLLDPYFSASKVAWILDHVEGARVRAERGELAFGTIDSFLIWRLTGGKRHVTDVTNASRTSLFNIHTLAWDTDLLSLFDVPKAILPEVLPCSAEFGETEASLLGDAIPILGVAGDQQAAAIGQSCFTPGDSKCTFGTGGFMLVNTGDQAVTSNNKLLTTIGYQIDGTTHYALEGSIFMAGAAVQWLRDGIGVIEHASETESLAMSLPYNHGVTLVPAFTGLGAPHWEPDARAAIYGMTRGTGPAHFARAALESVCFQTDDLISAMNKDGAKTTCLNVDGGMVANNWLCQFLSDLMALPVQRPSVMETTALGCAYLAGLSSGVYPDLNALKHINSPDAQFSPSMDNATRSMLKSQWDRVITATLRSI